MNLPFYKSACNKALRVKFTQQQVHTNLPLHLLNFIYLPVLITISSCYSPRYVYSPSTQNIPQLNKKGDINVGGYFASGGGSSSRNYPGVHNYNLGMDVHSAYSVSDHFGVMINKYNRWEKNDGANDFNLGDDAIINYRRTLTEFAAGYFTPLKNDRENNFFQVFAGTALGNFRLNETSLSNGIPFKRFHKSNITKMFIQPGFIFGQKKNFSTSFSSRFNAVFYNKIKTDYNSTELHNYLLDDLSSSSVFFWEPAINFALGFKKIKGIRLSAQSGFAVLMNRRFIDYRTINFAIGVIANKDLFKNLHKSK